MGKAGGLGLTVVDGRRAIEFCRVVILGVFLSSVSWAVNGDMGVGTEPLTDGSAAYPWLIEDLADFDAFAGNSAYWAAGVHTKLMTNIDLSGRTYTTAVIAPDTDPEFGFDGTSFRGVFDGNGFSVINLSIDAAGTGNDFLGLFGQVDGVGAEVKNLGLENTAIVGGNGSYYIGSLTGLSDHCDVVNCYSLGSVMGGSTVGGLIGSVDWYCKVNNSFSSGSVSGFASIGGFCGYSLGRIENCHAASRVSGWENSQQVGGFCGNNAGTVYKCFAMGDVSGDDGSYGIGGFCGLNSVTFTITNCYSIGRAAGGDNSYNIGGFCGINDAGRITKCYSKTSVLGGMSSYNLADFCGYQTSSYSSMDNSFWDSDIGTIGIGYNLNPSSPGTVTNVVGKSTGEMMTISTFTLPPASWDFTNETTNGTNDYWMMLREGEDYPRLAWQEVWAGDIAGLYGVDIVDLMEIARNWLAVGCPAGCEDADIDESGVVDLGDFALLADSWMRQ